MPHLFEDIKEGDNKEKVKAMENKAYDLKLNHGL